MVVCPIFKWRDIKILVGWWPALDNVRWEVILKGEITGGKKEYSFSHETQENANAL